MIWADIEPFRKCNKVHSATLRLYAQIEERKYYTEVDQNGDEEDTVPDVVLRHYNTLGIRPNVYVSNETVRK